MRGNRRALAGLFDALIFLTIASLVSVSLLSALGGPSEVGGRQGQRVDTAHSVLLRSTVLDARANPCAIEELFKLEDVEGMAHGDNISMVLDLLLPGMEWRWTVHRGNMSWSFGSDTVTQDTVYCSLVRALFNGAEVEYRLEAWTRYS